METLLTMAAAQLPHNLVRPNFGGSVERVDRSESAFTPNIQISNF